MNEQQQHTSPAASGGLAEYQRIESWLASEPNDVIRNKSSLDWLIKMHGAELVQRGALIRGAGRRPALVHRSEFPRAVLDIIKRGGTLDTKATEAA
jgi:hypothetical protein